MASPFPYYYGRYVYSETAGMKLESENSTTLQENRWLSILYIELGEDIANDTDELLLKFMSSTIYTYPYLILDQPDLHGSFRKAMLSPINYEKISIEESRNEFLELIVNPTYCEESIPLSSELLQQVIGKFDSICSDKSTCYRLRLDPLKHQYFAHELGQMMWEFHEFIFVDKNLQKLQVAAVCAD